jgi:HK97 family phage major capsid protein
MTLIARPSVVSSYAKGTSFARMAIAYAIAGKEGGTAYRHAERMWGENSPAALALKSIVAPGTMATGGWGDDLVDYRNVAAEFIEALRPSTIIGKLTNMRRAPLKTRLPRITAGVTVGWAAENSPMILSAMALDSITLDPLKIGGIVVSTAELAKFSSPSAEQLVRQDLVDAVAALSDRTFIDPSNAGEAGVSPASVTYGAPSVASTGTTAAAIKSDLKALFALLTGSELKAPALIMDRRTAVALAMKDSSDNFFGNVTVNGGTLAGVPLITSSSYPTNTASNSPPDYVSSIALVDAAEILIGDDGEATVDMARHASLQFESSPDSPQTAATVMVNLWQADLVAWRVQRFINWRLARANTVAVLTGVNY